MLRARGVRPRKHFGQNFMIDPNLLKAMVSDAGIVPQDTVCEIGSGYGALTGYLLETHSHVVAVEVDPALADVLRDFYGNHRDLTILPIDVFGSRGRLNAALMEVLRHASSVKVVANLPYSVGARVLVALSLSRLPVTRLTFTVQQEVAERISAKPGHRHYGPLSVMMQVWGSPVILRRRIPPEAFWPRPAIQSALVDIQVHPCPPDLPIRTHVMQLVKSCFARRRKTIANAMPECSSQQWFSCWLDRRGYHMRDRVEQLSPDVFVDLVRIMNP